MHSNSYAADIYIHHASPE